jgi:DNA polymerase-3 subunit alpha
MLEDHSGTIETLVWPENYKQVYALLVSEDPVVISGKIDGVEERRTFIANKVESLISLRDKNAKLGLLALKEHDHFEERLDTLLSLLKRHHGPCPVKVKLDIGGGEIALALKHRDSNPVSVIPSEVLCDEVEQLFGRPVLSFV